MADRPGPRTDSAGGPERPVLQPDYFPRRTATLPALLALALFAFGIVAAHRSLVAAAAFVLLAGAVGAAAMYMNRKDVRRAGDERPGQGSR